MLPVLPSSVALWCLIALLTSNATHTAAHWLPNVLLHGVRRSNDVPPSCAYVTSINATNNHFHVHHCFVNRSYLFRTMRPANASFLVRVVGPHTLYTGLSRHVNKYTHLFSYNLRHTGPHHTFIRVLLENAPRNNLTDACLSSLPTVDHTFDVADADRTSTVAMHNVDDDFCCWETPNDLIDRWSEFSDVSANKATVRQRYSDLVLNDSRLPTDDVLSTCIANATICLYGDSQTRNLRDSLLDFLTKQPAINVTLSYALLRYPVNLTNSLLATSSTPCTHRLFNYGQWPLGWVEHRPWTMDELKSELKTFLERVHSLTGYIYWMSTGTFPQAHPKVAACPPQDWRMLTHIDAYNQLAKALVRHYPSIHYIDTFRAMLHLHDFTFDGSHYQEPVAPGLARVLLSQMCERVVMY